MYCFDARKSSLLKFVRIERIVPQTSFVTPPIGHSIVCVTILTRHTGITNDAPIVLIRNVSGNLRIIMIGRYNNY